MGRVGFGFRTIRAGCCFRISFRPTFLEVNKVRYDYK